MSDPAGTDQSGQPAQVGPLSPEEAGELDWKLPQDWALVAQDLFGDALSAAMAYARLLARQGIEWGLLGPRETSRLWDRHILNSAFLARYLTQPVTVGPSGNLWPDARPFPDAASRAESVTVGFAGNLSPGLPDLSTAGGDQLAESDAGQVRPRGQLDDRPVDQAEPHPYQPSTPHTDLPCRWKLLVADIGSGAGLPGIPLALACPDLRVDLVEPMQRRVDFLQLCVEELDLTPQVRVVRCRAEDYSEQPDVVVCRALAPLKKILTLCAGLVPPARLLAVKGASAAEEISAASSLLKKQSLRAKLSACQLDGRLLGRVVEVST